MKDITLIQKTILEELCKDEIFNPNHEGKMPTKELRIKVLLRLNVSITAFNVNIRKLIKNGFADFDCPDEYKKITKTEAAYNYLISWSNINITRLGKSAIGKNSHRIIHRT